ncbi:AAA family ATPase [Azospirillum halopraeferens]|uniref:AAA family ATPase n=1 Tax=Azospirillum halopraeferens TaxID=34010 RepID=UPI0003FF8637|nr:AAA family ATPase [Azospirillum halopraeferens]
MRIGLTGSAGTGKTTLALTMAGTLGVPVLHERMRERLRAGFSLHALTRAEHRALLRDDAEDLEARAAAAPAGFVADRTPLDFLAFWLCNGYAADDPAGTDAFAAQARAAVAAWDLIVVLPWGSLPLEDDGIRYANPWHQLHAQTVIEGLCRRWVAADRLAFLPDTVREPDGRCAWVLRRAQAR